MMGPLLTFPRLLLGSGTFNRQLDRNHCPAIRYALAFDGLVALAIVCSQQVRKIALSLVGHHMGRQSHCVQRNVFGILRKKFVLLVALNGGASAGRPTRGQLLLQA